MNTAPEFLCSERPLDNRARLALYRQRRAMAELTAPEAMLEGVRVPPAKPFPWEQWAVRS